MRATEVLEIDRKKNIYITYRTDERRSNNGDCGVFESEKMDVATKINYKHANKRKEF